MRIGLSTTHLEPAVNHGRIDGIGVYTQQLLHGYQARGLAVQGYSYTLDAQVGHTLGRKFSRAMLLGLISHGLWRQRCEVDIFHATDYCIAPMSCPVVATLFDAIPLANPSMVNPRFVHIKNAIRRATTHYIDHVISISNAAADEVAYYYRWPRAQISVVYCGVEHRWLEPVATDAQQALLQQLQLEPGYFLFVSTLQPRKNLERVLAAHQNLPEPLRRQRPLVVVGKAGWRCDELVEQLKVATQTPYVRWLNQINQTEQLRLLYASAGALVFPSLHEGFGLPVIEAFASRIPVVTSNTTSLPEVSAGIGIEVDPLAVDKITQAMEAIIQPSEQWRIAAGYQRAQQFTWDHTVEQTLEVYQQVLNKK